MAAVSHGIKLMNKMYVISPYGMTDTNVSFVKTLIDRRTVSFKFTN